MTSRYMAITEKSLLVEFIVFILFIYLLCLSSLVKSELVLHPYTEHLAAYKNFIGDINPIDVNEFSAAKGDFNRGVVDITLLLKTMRLGGFDESVTFDGINHIRFEIYIANLISGKIPVTSEALPHSSIRRYSGNVLISEPVIRRGELVVGLYTSPDNHKALSVSSEDISSLSAISNKAWVVDWMVLESMRLKYLQHSETWRYMIKATARLRADFILHPIQPGDMILNDHGFTLVPIKGVKVSIPDSFHFVISKKYRRSKELVKAVNLGLHKMRKNGFINKSYTESGVFTSEIDNWVTLNP